MGFLDKRKRVELGDGDWVEVRPLSAGALRHMREEVSKIVPPEGSSMERDEAQGYALQQMALEACVTAWSDEAPVTPENIQKIPYDMVMPIAVAIGLRSKEEQEVPLPTGPTSTDS